MGRASVSAFRERGLRADVLMSASNSAPPRLRGEEEIGTEKPQGRSYCLIGEGIQTDDTFPSVKVIVIQSVCHIENLNGRRLNLKSNRPVIS